MTRFVLTPTGGRPEAFQQCVKMMRTQSAYEVVWIIVDDGPQKMPTPEIPGWEVIHIRPMPLWKPGQNTQTRNLRVGLEHIPDYDSVAIVEDDDWYADWWLEKVFLALSVKPLDLVGECLSVYRNLKTGSIRKCGNKEHASLCSTAAARNGIIRLKEIVKSDNTTFIDLKLWGTKGLKKHLFTPEPRGVLGIKGYPGRPGIGVGHRS